MMPSTCKVPFRRFGTIFIARPDQASALLRQTDTNEFAKLFIGEWNFADEG